MRRIDFRPSVIEARIYDEGGYKDRTAYLGSFVIHLIGEVAEITLLTGSPETDGKCWDIGLNRELMGYLLSMDVKFLRYEHKGVIEEREVAASSGHIAAVK